MKQIFIENHIGKPLEHEYNLSIKKIGKINSFNLFDSTNEFYQATLSDTGNSIELISDEQGCIKLSYCEALKFFILLTENNKTKIEFRKFITLKKI